MGQNWAITIGINEYDNLRGLKYAQRDAESMRDFFREQGFQEVYFFAKDAPPIPASNSATIPADPTTSRLRNFLRRRLAGRPLEAGDTLWFFFAGHGKRKDERDYLMPIDADPGDVAGTGLAVRDLVEVLRGSGAGNVILLIDACRDEGSRDGVGIGLERQQGVITLFSCAPEQQSYEIEELDEGKGAGAFTYALLQGLRIQGEGNCATVARLADHVRVQVPYLVERYRGVRVKQNPYLIAEPASKQNLILLPKQASPADVMALKYEAAQAENEGDFELAEVFWSRVLIANPAAYQEVFRAIQRLGIKKHTAEQTGFSSQAKTTQPATVGDRSTGPERTKNDGRALQTFAFEVVKLDDRGTISKTERLQNQGFLQPIADGIDLTMMRMPAGTFTMGSPASEQGRNDNEGHQREVSIAEFFMAQTPITQAQWRAVARLTKVKIDLEADPSGFKGDTRPVERVSWDEAVEFCVRLSRHTQLSYRLPSEAEWEYACRAGTTTPFHFGATLDATVANYDARSTYGKGKKGEYRQQTTPVGSFPANAWGLFDCHGNVWEWCEDNWHVTYENAPTNGSAWIDKTSSGQGSRVLRGGSWSNNPRDCRSACRLNDAAGTRYIGLGFRVVVEFART